MSNATEYRRRAAAYRQSAKIAQREIAVELEELATMCIRLADLVDQGEVSDLLYEPEPPKLNLVN